MKLLRRRRKEENMKPLRLLPGKCSLCGRVFVVIPNQEAGRTLFSYCVTDESSELDVFLWEKKIICSRCGNQTVLPAEDYAGAG